jgi:hypothetical protein
MSFPCDLEHLSAFDELISMALCQQVAIAFKALEITWALLAALSFNFLPRQLYSSFTELKLRETLSQRAPPPQSKANSPHGFCITPHNSRSTPPPQPLKHPLSLTSD